MTKKPDMRNRSSGNVLFAVFAAVVLVGILGAAVTSFIKGPLTTAVKQTRVNGAKAQMQIAAQVSVMAAANGSTINPIQATVFVTSSIQGAALGGLSGADTICQNLANTAGVSGTYKAWLSDSTGSPSTRFIQSNVPYKNVLGATIANNWADLIDGTLSNAINVNESGSVGATSNLAFTNTNVNGTPYSVTDHCTNFTSSSGALSTRVGDRRDINSTWTNNSSAFCNAGSRFYCFEQPVAISKVGDCDNDGTVEPLEYRLAGASPAPVGGGLIPTSVGTTKKDPWGSEYGYCVWDYGSVALNATCQQTTSGTNLRLAGHATAQDTPVVAIVSAGPDKTFSTTCRSYATADANSNGSLNDTGDLALVGKANSNDDDLIFTYTYTQATAATGGLWSLKSSSSNTAIIGKKNRGAGS